MIRTRSPRRPSSRGRRLFAAAALAALCAFPAPATAAAATPPDGDLRRVQREIEAGFRRGEADRIAALLSPKMKTYVAFRPLAAEDGYYGADQLRLLLRRLYRGRTTTGFRVVQQATLRGDGQAVLEAVWSFRDAGAPAADARLAFTLAREAGAWRLREIRDLA